MLELRHYKDFMRGPIKQSRARRLWYFVVRFVAILLQLPPISIFFRNTFLGTCGYVGLLRARHQHIRAVDHLISLLTGKHFRRNTLRWWYLMRLAVTLLQDRQLVGDPKILLRLNQLIQLGSSGPAPKNGYDVAYSFIGFGLWSFQQGRMKEASRCVQEAIDADKTWGYPEYLMGWLGLFDKEIDAVTHFVKAAQCDWEALHRMKRDPICQLHPKIIQEVKKKLLVAKNSKNKIEKMQ